MTEIKKHWDRVAKLGCLISATPNPTLHHCHGASMLDYVPTTMARKTSDWLVIPIAATFHTGDYGCDSGISMMAWEAAFGTQVQFLDKVSELLGYSVWEKAGIER